MTPEETGLTYTVQYEISGDKTYNVYSQYCKAWATKRGTENKKR